MFKITEDDLTMWAENDKKAEHVLPDLIRRLLFAMIPQEGIVVIDFPSYKGVNSGGYDGIFKTKTSTIFSKTSSSVWEISVRADIASKANSDYKKRTDDSESTEKKKTTFVFVTGRRWSNKSTWAEEKMKEDIWADLRAFDATDLAQWLSQSPSVSIWFSSILKKPVEGFKTVDLCFNEWASRTKPPLTESIPLVGRTKEIKMFREWLKNKSKTLKVRAETIEECIIFSCATMLSADKCDRENWTARTVVVTNSNAWDYISKVSDSIQQSLVILPFFKDFDGSSYVSKNHHLLFPSQIGQVRKDIDIELNALSREELSSVLIAILGDDNKAKQIAFQCGGKITSLQRLLGYTYKVPQWTSNNNMVIKNALLLAGIWIPGNPGDEKILVDLAGGIQYPEIERFVSKLLSVPDVPIRKRGEAIKWRSIRDAWQLLAGSLTTDDLNRFKNVCIKRLKIYDPKYDLPIEERMYAGITGKVLLESTEIRMGLVESLVWLSVYHEEIENVLQEGFVTDLVNEILRKILDSDWRVWATLGSSLSDLAEAAPDEFLISLKKVIKKKSCQFEQLFHQDPKGKDFLGAEACQAGLLFALETLAWNEDYFSQVAFILAELLEFDPGGSYSNRPFDTLKTLFHPFFRRTRLSNEGRKTTINALTKRYNSQCWRLFSSLMEEYALSSSIILSDGLPKFRDWGLASSLQFFSKDEAFAYHRFVKEQILKLIEEVPERVIELLKSNYSLDLDVYQKIMDFLNLHLQYFKSKDSEKKSHLCNHLRQMIQYFHRCQNGGVDNEDLIRNASDLVEAFMSESQAENDAWLFSQFPKLPEREDEDFDKYEAKIESLRLEAIRKILDNDNSFSEFLKLSTKCEQPNIVGFTLASIPEGKEFQTKIFEEAICEGVNVKKFAFGYVRKMYIDNGFSWLENSVRGILIEKQRIEEATDVLSCIISTSEIRKWIMTQSESISRLYWKKVDTRFDGVKDDSDFALLVDNLLKVKRWDGVVEMAGFVLHKNPKVGKATEYLKILHHGKVASESEIENVLRGQLGIYHLVRIFSYLDNCEDEVDFDELFNLEIFYLEILKNSERPPKYINLKLEQNTEFFVELICLCYRNSKKEDNLLTKTDKEKVERLGKTAFRILEMWKGYPGINLSKEARNQKLKEWCDSVLRLTENEDRKVIGEQMVGKVLSRVPSAEEDKIWPCIVAREYIEMGYENIAIGINLEKYNSRGPTSRAPTDGGSAERRMAKSFLDDADKLKHEWPNTSAFLKSIGESYNREAKWHDNDSEEFVDP